MMILSPSHRNSSRVFAILLTYHGQHVPGRRYFSLLYLVLMFWGVFIVLVDNTIHDNLNFSAYHRIAL